MKYEANHHLVLKKKNTLLGLVSPNDYHRGNDAMHQRQGSLIGEAKFSLAHKTF